MYLSVLNGVSWDMEQVHCGICEIGLFCKHIQKTYMRQCPSNNWHIYIHIYKVDGYSNFVITSQMFVRSHEQYKIQPRVPLFVGKVSIRWLMIWRIQRGAGFYNYIGYAWLQINSFPHFKRLHNRSLIAHLVLIHYIYQCWLIVNWTDKKTFQLADSLSQENAKCRPLNINSLRPSDSYMRQLTNSHWFR